MPWYQVGTKARLLIRPRSQMAGKWPRGISARSHEAAETGSYGEVWVLSWGEQ